MSGFGGSPSKHVMTWLYVPSLVITQDYSEFGIGKIWQVLNAPIL